MPTRDCPSLRGLRGAGGARRAGAALRGCPPASAMPGTGLPRPPSAGGLVPSGCLSGLFQRNASSRSAAEESRQRGPSFLAPHLFSGAEVEATMTVRGSLRVFLPGPFPSSWQKSCRAARPPWLLCCCSSFLLQLCSTSKFFFRKSFLICGLNK